MAQFAMQGGRASPTRRGPPEALAVSKGIVGIACPAGLKMPAIDVVTFEEFP